MNPKLLNPTLWLDEKNKLFKRLVIIHLGRKVKLFWVQSWNRLLVMIGYLLVNLFSFFINSSILWRSDKSYLVKHTIGRISVTGPRIPHDLCTLLSSTCVLVDAHLSCEGPWFVSGLRTCIYRVCNAMEGMQSERRQYRFYNALSLSFSDTI